MEKKPELILASYVTYKELYKCKKYKSQYQILAEFVKYAIYENKLYQFSSVEMKKMISDIFGFELPNAVLKSVLKKIDCIEKNGVKDEFSVNQNAIILDGTFEAYRSSAEKENTHLIDLLYEFTEKRLNRELSGKDKQELSQNFMAYLLDKSNGGSYQDSISTFILSYENDPMVSQQLDSIREGCILYTGINYNIDEMGSVTEELVLYLDMEVLFDLYGYNGDLFKDLAQDMLKLIRVANSKRRYIILRYFYDTKLEIEEFFRKAENIVLGKELLKDNVAMKVITAGCKDATDISDRQADFFHAMQYSFGIIEDPEKDYYKLDQYAANLEGITFEESRNVDNVSALEQSIKFISNINKLRKNELTNDYFKCKYILVTETRRTLDASKAIMKEIRGDADEEKQYAAHAVNISFITNLLWYKLNKGLGINEYPHNVNAVIKAKIVLSNYVSQNIANIYEECKRDYKEGKITQEQFAARILALRNRNSRPEEITVDTVEDDLNFDPENIKRYEEESKWQKVKLQEKDEQLEKYKQDYNDIQQEITLIQFELNESTKEREKQNKTLENQGELILKQNNIIEQQSKVIQKYETIEKNKAIKKEKKKRIVRFTLNILLRILILAVIVVGVYFVTKRLKADLATSVSIVVTIIGIIFSCIDIIKNVYKKIFV